MLTVGAGLTMAVLNGTLTNVALPAIARDLQADAAASIWVVNAFQLIVTVTLLPLASLGDIVGYRRIYIGGLIVFTLGSLGCALADSLLLLVGARVLQGLGAAGIMSVTMALVRFIYPRAMVGRGIAITVMVVATNAAAGPTIQTVEMVARIQALRRLRASPWRAVSAAPRLNIVDIAVPLSPKPTMPTVSTVARVGASDRAALAIR